MKNRDIYQHLLTTTGICAGPCAGCTGCDHISNHDSWEDTLAERAAQRADTPATCDIPLSAWLAVLGEAKRII